MSRVVPFKVDYTGFLRGTPNHKDTSLEVAGRFTYQPSHSIKRLLCVPNEGISSSINPHDVHIVYGISGP